MLARFLPAIAIAALAPIASGQVCRLSVAGVNRNRRAAGPIAVECPDPLHTAPFGNYGVTSNFGSKQNGHQFDGWCHDMRICDNAGNCRNACRDGWYEWNSCTTNALFSAPNCTLYNDKECTEQATTTGVNVLGTQTVDLPVACPSSSNGLTYDRGGCNEIRGYSRTNNFMSVYELDPITGDELVQTILYPGINTPLDCTAWGCPAAGSEWVQPSGFDSPAGPGRISAEMAMVVNFGSFIDQNNACRLAPLPLRTVSSATFAESGVAPDSLATIFAGGVVVNEESAMSQPLPATLGGVQVRVTDSGGAARNAGMVYAGRNQINFVVPPGLREGTATVAVIAGNTTRAMGPVRIARTEAGLFAANANGQGVAAAVGIRVAADGAQTRQDAFACSANGCFAMPLDLGGSSEQFVLVLFGTGIRSAAAVQATAGGLPASVLFAGAQPTFAGLDQVNLLLPKALAGRGIVDVRVTVDGREANPLNVWIR